MLITSKNIWISFLFILTPYSLLPTPCSLLPVPYSLFPTPCSLCYSFNYPLIIVINMIKKITLDSIWFRNLLIIVIVLGVVFRFYNLDRKVYWYDETMTSLRISGHTRTELVEEIFDGQIISVQNLLKYYQFPNYQKDINDTINSLAGNPEHSPLYYLMARLWLQTFGNSVATIRLLSVIISLLALPCAYWLCLELFGSKLIGWVAVAIIAISPFHVLYAQEAREYSLWTVTILLSSAVLLWAMNSSRIKQLIKKPYRWIIYSFTVALALYTHPFSAFVLIGQGLYVLITEGGRWTKGVTSYLLACLGGVLLFSPWLIIVIINFSKFIANTDSVNHSRSGFLPLFWTLNLSRIFFDVNQGIHPLSPLHYLSLCLAVYALYYLCRKAPQHAWVFIITLIGVTGIALIAPDVLLGGRRSSITRYAIPCYLGIQLAIAYFLTTEAKNSGQLTKDKGKKGLPTMGMMNGNLANPEDRQNQQVRGDHDMVPMGKTRQNPKPWKSIAIALAFSGILSCIVSSQLPVWWHKSYAKSRNNPSVAAWINQIPQPLLISNEIPGRVLSLCHLLRPDVQLMLLDKSNSSTNIPEIPEGFKNVLLYRPSEELRQGIETTYNYRVKPTDQSWLWKLSR
ncbi:glycosyltransferase family 39 protein [Moorena bouillonii]|nr:glycosyltransferase family 39 protein [Moorena bouillonii]